MWFLSFKYPLFNLFSNIIIHIIGGPDINISWLDAITGCHGICFMDDQNVTFSNFEWAPVEN